MATVRPSFFGQHLTNKLSAAIVPKSGLEKGMVIQTRYKTLEGKTTDYMFLILQPLYLGKVHVLSLNEFTVIRLNELAKETGLRVIPKFRKRGLAIPKLIMNESAQRFYHGKLMRGGDMKRLYNNSYRTLFQNKMALCQLIDYDFDDSITVI
tara:strand:+ start:3165 stop:3620 length:456 start_codon:yes stop_codon:yes gene_type:complete